jgi:hypothetical protein
VGLLRGESEMSFSFSFLVELCYLSPVVGKAFLRWTSSPRWNLVKERTLLWEWEKREIARRSCVGLLLARLHTAEIKYPVLVDVYIIDEYLFLRHTICVLDLRTPYRFWLIPDIFPLFLSLPQTILSSIFCGLGTVLLKLSLFSSASLYLFRL